MKPMWSRGLFAILVSAAFLLACNESTPKVKYKKVEDKTKYKQKLIQANRGLVEQDADSIKSFLKTKGWNMTERGRGLWYEIQEQGSGKRAEKEMIISLHYKLSLLDGTLLYSSDSLGVKSFKVGQGGVESGLEEAVLLFRKGTKARVILPPHLAHGLTGDNNKVPPRAIVMYEVEVVDLKAPNQ